ncbi:hypothetical protein SETIT_5G059900v2 [Setaria italica]|uniref:CCHC-type domain-containing protein n=1 Tax=Setaria italica TaxID=4555 RepID=K3XH94_SETIT|nr:uncharacterized protein LOC101770172 isoform X2 [Setaria italica]RCV24129.1 hypothetical protein SETIT_5G059900v2 [Setaria italica]RCV24130.1 hypothetical protein SETIT_5G059900v2 [Setaria italica]
MAREPSPEIDDELFNEVYGKAYNGPVAPATNSVMPKVNDEKRPLSRDKSDDEEEAPDPNAVPTDFTSREAKVWEAKAKATERNWKKRKEEEMICKICGDSGHFTQGCPSTLGANRRNADFFERVPARDKQVRNLFTESMISQIEKDVGCKIRMDEKFLFVSGKDRLILAKGVDAVHKIIQESKGKYSQSSPKRDRSRSPVRNTTEFRPRHSDSHQSHSPRISDSRRSCSPRISDSRRSRSPRNASRSQSKGYYNERHLDGRLHDSMPKFSKGSPQAYANFGAKGRPAQSKFPRHSSYLDVSPRTHGENNQFAASNMANNWGIERHEADVRSSLKFDVPSHQQTLEELEMEFKREATELARARNQEEDEENYKHRESLRVMRENYMDRVTTMRNMHARTWEEFFEQTFKRQQQAQTSYSQIGYPGFEQRTTHISAALQPMDSKSTYPYASDNYSAPKAHAAYGKFQHERHGDLGRTYGRY